jgi:hypothetical protein
MKRIIKLVEPVGVSEKIYSSEFEVTVVRNFIGIDKSEI